MVWSDIDGFGHEINAIGIYDGKGRLKLLVYPCFIVGTIIVGIEWEQQLGVLVINLHKKGPSSGYAA